jgi:uncharacterized protein (DUF58 family)
MVFLSRFYFALVAAIVLALGSNWIIGGVLPSLGLTLLLCGAVLADIAFCPRDALRVQRKIPATVRQAGGFAVELTLLNAGEASAVFEILDSPPPEFSGDSPRLVVRLRPHQERVHVYHLQSYQRANFSFGPVYYRLTGPLGLIQRQGRVDLPQEIRVLPDLAGEGSRDLRLALAGALHAGPRQSPRLGEGREFESLREHQHDDDFRHIDWKASARRGKLITRQYEMERDQRLMILLDAGRLMSPRIGPYRKLDYAVNAAVHLAQVALTKGDLIGYAIFNDELRVFAEPKKGHAQMARFVADLTPLQPSRAESDYAAVFHHVLRRCSRRTLVVCLTDLGDGPSAERLERAVLPLLPRHLPVVVTVSNSELLAVTRGMPTDDFGVYRHIAAMELWDDYQRTLCDLRARGVATVSVPAAELSTATINQYLRVKESARL